MVSNKLIESNSRLSICSILKTWVSICTILFYTIACNTATNQLVQQPKKQWYDSSLHFKDNLLNGWIETFEQDGIAFCIRYDSLTNSYLIQNQQSPLHHAPFDIHDDFEKVDYNNDGFNDLFSFHQRWAFINFYLPRKKTFSKQYQLPGDNQLLIDSANKLYINYAAPYHGCNAYLSQLLDYKNSEPTIHYVYEGETACNEDSIVSLNLYKYDRTNDSMILLKKYKPANKKEFNYVNFWKAHYRELMTH